MRLKWLWTALGAVCLSLGNLKAQENMRELVIKNDNDAYLVNGSDRYYTNGFFVSFRSAAHRRALAEGQVKKIKEFEFGQKMYTSHSGYVWERSRVDRAITAYLFVGASQTWYYASEKVLKLGVQLGTIGPNAMGRQTQEIFHKITGTYAPNCWKYELNNEIGLNTQLAYQDLLFRNADSNFDLTWNGYLNLGNTFTGTGAGLSMRLGKLKALYESTFTRGLAGNSNKEKKQKTAEFFFVGRIQLDLVAYDASISGGLFRKNKGPIVFEPRPVVWHKELGIMHSKNRFSAQLSYIFKSREIKSAAVPARYGSLTTAFLF